VDVTFGVTFCDTSLRGIADRLHQRRSCRRAAARANFRSGKLMPHFSSSPRPGHSAISRRSFLRDAAGGTAAITLVSMLPAGCAGDYPQAGADGVTLAALTPKEYAVARSAAEALLVDVPVSPSSVAAAIDAELAVAGDPMRGDMKTVLGLIEHLTVLGGRFGRFSSLDAEARRTYLAGWSTSRFKLRRGAFQALKGFVEYFAYLEDETRTLTGFEGPWPERLSIPAYPVDFGEVT
jgi:hypothetical protein